MEKEALFYDRLADNVVQCKLCAHHCLVKPGRKGICLVRQNNDGILYSLTYGNLIAQHDDPIEKKPLYHFLPGSHAWSIAAPGCNFQCEWCQNWEISQMPRYSGDLSNAFISPDQVVQDAVDHKCASIAYTYTEPTIFYEFSRDVGLLAKARGLRNVFVTNGYMTPEVIRDLSTWLDAANVDIKAFSDTAYQKLINARLQPVLQACRLMKEQGIWLEITTLVIPGVNDDLEEMKQLAGFIAGELGVETPWHVSRYYPSYKFGRVAATPPETIRKIVEVGRSAGLYYVYEGNLHRETSTYCPKCGELVLSRGNYFVNHNKIADNSKCPGCGFLIAGREIYKIAHS